MTAPITNWAGNITFVPAHLHRPATLDELRTLVAGSDRVRVLGSGHSFNHLADTDGVLVSLAGLPPRVEIDAAARTVTVSGGVRLGEVSTRLHAEGWALANLPSLPHISVAGTVTTATHGSGVGNRNIAAAVAAVELVDAAGRLRTLRRGEHDEFPGAVVALGALGVMSGLTLDLVPSFEVRQWVYDDVPRDTVLAHLDEALSAAYSVSLFTNLTTDRFNQIWLKQRVDDAAGPPAPSWLGGRLADAARHPVPGMPATNATEQLGRPGPWHERLPHFRMEFTPSNGQELQSEFFVAREHGADALRELAAIADRVAPVLQVCEVRTIAADDLWLSPNYRRDSLALHFTWIPDAGAVASAVAEIERRLDPLAVRPHWGKVFSLPPGTLRERYERFDDFARLAGAYDPDGKFRNAFIDRYFPAG